MPKIWKWTINEQFGYTMANVAGKLSTFPRRERLDRATKSTLGVRQTNIMQKDWPGFEPGSPDYAYDILGQLNYLNLTLISSHM